MTDEAGNKRVWEAPTNLLYCFCTVAAGSYQGMLQLPPNLLAPSVKDWKGCFKAAAWCSFNTSCTCWVQVFSSTLTAICSAPGLHQVVAVEL